MVTFHVVPLMECILFARVCSHVDVFNAHKTRLTAKLLKEGYRYHNLRKVFPSSIADTMNWFQNSISD